MSFPLRASIFIVLTVALRCVTVTGQTGSPRVDVTGTRVSLVPPPEFVPADRFPGFVGPDGASIQVTEMPAPFKQASAGITDPEMTSKQGMRLVAPPQTIALSDGTPALWIQMRQDHQGERFSKWICAFGNTSHTVMLIATVPENRASGSEQMFKQAFLTATWKPAISPTVDTAGLPYVVRPAPGFEILGRIGAQIVVGLAGTGVVDKSGGPRLIFGASTEMVSAGQLAPTAAGLIRTITPDVFLDRVVRTKRPITTAGKPGYEIIATARHREGYPLSLYLVVIADGVGNLQVFGMCRLEEEATHLPVFRRMVETLSLR